MPGLPKLDRIDINILVQLQNDGAISDLYLAEQIGLSPSPCLQRVKRLEQAGYITGYGAQINPAKLIDSVTVFTEVTLVDHRIDDFIKFEANIRDVERMIHAEQARRAATRRCCATPKLSASVPAASCRWQKQLDRSRCLICCVKARTFLHLFNRNRSLPGRQPPPLIDCNGHQREGGKRRAKFSRYGIV